MHSFFGQPSLVSQDGEVTIPCKKKKQLNNRILSHNMQDHTYIHTMTVKRRICYHKRTTIMFACFCRHFTFVKMVVCNYEMLLF